MKRMLYSFATGVILTAGVLLSLVAFAQDSLLGFVRPLVVDIRQAVPVVADVVVPLEDGESVTATVPLTVDIALQVSVFGIVSRTLMLVEQTEPDVTIATATPVVAGAIESSSFVGYNQLPLLEPGNIGELSIVAIGVFDVGSTSTTIPVVVRNNTDEAVRRVEISAVASNTDGKMIAVGGGDGFRPNLVAPGELSMGYIYFSDVLLPKDASIEYEATSKQVDGFENIRDLIFKDHDTVDNRIVGLLTNPYDVEVTGPIGIDVYCFDSRSSLVAHFNDYADKDSVGAVGTIPFQVSVEQPCDFYLMSASGYE